MNDRRTHAVSAQIGARRPASDHEKSSAAGAVPCDLRICQACGVGLRVTGRCPRCAELARLEKLNLKLLGSIDKQHWAGWRRLRRLPSSDAR